MHSALPAMDRDPAPLSFLLELERTSKRYGYAFPSGADASTSAQRSENNHCGQSFFTFLRPSLFVAIARLFLVVFNHCPHS